MKTHLIKLLILSLISFSVAVVRADDSGDSAQDMPTLYTLEAMGDGLMVLVPDDGGEPFEVAPVFDSETSLPIVFETGDPLVMDPTTGVLFEPRFGDASMAAVLYAVARGDSGHMNNDSRPAFPLTQVSGPL